MKILVIYNPNSGLNEITHGKFQEYIKRNLDNWNGTENKILFKDVLTDNIENDFEKGLCTDSDLIIISGGDGTISRNIKYGIDYKIPIAIIPSGTFNNFASDNGIPIDLNDALEVIKKFNIVNIDAGKIGEKYFINNSSIGLYAESVKLREETENNSGMNKFTAMMLAAVRVFYIFPMYYTEILVENKSYRIKTPFVFVGNNKYEFDLFSFGRRISIDSGKLFIYFTNCRFRFCLLKIAFKALFNKLNNEKSLISHAVDGFELKSGKKAIKVAMDGELYTMKTPINYKILPQALQIVVPKK